MTTLVVDLGVGNTQSLLFALERLGAKAALSRDPARLGEAPRLILAGVGHAGFVMARIEELGLADLLRTFPRPLLGICLGLQLLHQSSGEGDTPALGRIAGRVEPLVATPDRPVPHMGWNRLHLGPPHALTEGVVSGDHVYFVHGYAARAEASTIAAVEYGGRWSAIAASGTAMGCQFHPERSGAVGARILSNFLGIQC